MEGSSMHSGHCGIRTHGTKQKVPALYCSTMWISTEVRRRFWRQEFITWFLCCGSYLWVRVYKGCIRLDGSRGSAELRRFHFWAISGSTGTTPPDPRAQCATLALCQSAGRCITLWQLLAGGGTHLGMRSNLPKQCTVCEIPQLATLFRSGLTHRDKENTRLAAILAKRPDQRKRNFIMGIIAYILTHR